MKPTDFKSQKITDNTWRIITPGCDCYLLEGTDEAFMIDSGMSAQDIRAFAQSLTPLPVSRVINTHSHFDHTAGNGFFDVIYGTEGIARSAKIPWAVIRRIISSIMLLLRFRTMTLSR